MAHGTGASADGGPLAGLSVLDLGALLPGPFCTAILADLGAEVTRVEAPAGDYMRGLPGGPFEQANRNKRGVVLDLGDAAQRDACLRLAASADVVVEGFRPGVAERLGVGYDDVRRVREDVVYCSISGFGETGPRRDDPGHDLVYLAAGGVLSLAGHWGEPPRRPGIPVSDLVSATFAAIAILAALHDRSASGRGGHVDLSIADAALSLAAVRGTREPGEGADGRPAIRHLSPTNDLFETADGVTLAVSAVEEPFWRSLRALVAPHDAAIEDPRFDEESGRRRHGDQLKRLLDRVFASRPSEDWLRELRSHDVPVQPVLTMDEALAEPQFADRHVVAVVDGERYVPFPARRDGVPMGTVRSPAPDLGADNESILSGAR